MIDLQRVFYILKNIPFILNLYLRKGINARTLIKLVNKYIKNEKKIIKIDFKSGYVTSKKFGALNFFNISLGSYLLDYYKNELGLDFSYYNYEDTKEYYVKSPIVNTLKNAPIEDRCKETLRILNAYLNSDKFSFRAKDDLARLGIRIEAQLLDCNMDNFFVYRDKIYLLDVENIIVCIQG